MDLSLQWVGPHPLPEPAREGIAWALAPSETETESYVWASTLGMHGTWRPFGLATLTCKTVTPPLTFRPRDDLDSSRWLASQAWWENLYTDQANPLLLQVWAAGMAESLTHIAKLHEEWREEAYFTLDPAVTASGVRALGREISERWHENLPRLTLACQAQAIRFEPSAL